MEKPKFELSDAYRKSRSGVSVLSGVAVAWAAAQFEFSSVKLPVLGDVVLTQYAVPVFLSVSIAYSMMRCTTEFVMQTNEVRRWSMAQFDYKITLIAACVSILLLAASGVSRSINTVFVTAGIGILLFIAFFAVSFVLTMVFTPIILFLRLRKRPNTSTVGGVLTAMAYASIFSGLGIIGTIAVGGSNFLFKGYDYFGLTETPNPIAVTVFLSTAILFVVGCFFHVRLLNLVFAFEPPYTVKTRALKDGRTSVSFDGNDKQSPQSKT